MKRPGAHYSILQGEQKQCYITGAKSRLQKHHIFFGHGFRKISDKNGFWVWLLPEFHNAGPEALHNNPGGYLDTILKRRCQRAFEKECGAEAFDRLIGRNYIPLKEAAALGYWKEVWEAVAEINRLNANFGINEVYTEEDYFKTKNFRPFNGCWLCEYETQFGEVESCRHSKPHWEEAKSPIEAVTEAEYLLEHPGEDERGFYLL